MSNFYVYALIDPRNDEIFYIGKGSGKRISQHVKMVHNGKADNEAKCIRIIEIHKSGHSVIERKLLENLEQGEAYDYERMLIASHQNLTNIHPGCMSYQEKSKLGAQRLLLPLKPYAEVAERISRELYDKFERELQELAMHGQQEWYEAVWTR